MKSTKLNLPELSIDELWALHEEVGTVLSEKISAEKRELEDRLARLNRHVTPEPHVAPLDLKNMGSRPARRKYPPVAPKFQNPSDPMQTWAGRGKQPRWLVSQLEGGKHIDDFLIDQPKRERASRR